VSWQVVVNIFSMKYLSKWTGTRKRMNTIQYLPLPPDGFCPVLFLRSTMDLMLFTMKKPVRRSLRSRHQCKRLHCLFLNSRELQIINSINNHLFKMILQLWMKLRCSVLVEGCYVRSNTPLGFIKAGKFLTCWATAGFSVRTPLHNVVVDVVAVAAAAVFLPVALNLLMSVRSLIHVEPKMVFLIILIRDGYL
jgi:hypothetical protein